MKKKILMIVFGNESRGVSNYIKNISKHKIVIPHFGPKDSSYNLSVSCGMVLFYLFSAGILPGSFTEIRPDKATEMISLYLLDSFKKKSRKEIRKLGLSECLDDY